MLQQTLRQAIQRRYPAPTYTIESLTTTKHENVVRIFDHDSGNTMVAKGIFHVEENDEMGPTAMNRAFSVESEVLSMLPSWWGFGLVDAFHAGNVRIIVTPELQTYSWRDYKPSLSVDRLIADTLEKQLRWLHSQHIAHRDLELKNVLLTPAGPVIIDFEKANLDASREEMVMDWRKLIDSLRESDGTRRIGTLLAERAPFARRKSVGGSRTRRSRLRKQSVTRRRRN